MLEKFLNSDNEIIRDTAKVANEYIVLYENGEISKNEYKDLLEDLLDIEQVDSLANDIETKELLTQAFKQILTIVFSLI